jgi:hypothetical protein
MTREVAKTSHQSHYDELARDGLLYYNHRFNIKVDPIQGRYWSAKTDDISL